MGVRGGDAERRRLSLAPNRERSLSRRIFPSRLQRAPALSGPARPSSSPTSKNKMLMLVAKCRWSVLGSQAGQDSGRGSPVAGRRHPSESLGDAGTLTTVGGTDSEIRTLAPDGIGTQPSPNLIMISSEWTARGPHSRRSARVRSARPAWPGPSCAAEPPRSVEDEGRAPAGPRRPRTGSDSLGAQALSWVASEMTFCCLIKRSASLV